MKYIFSVLLAITFCFGHAQTKESVINVPSSQWGTFPALLYKPTTTGSVPLLIFLHGKGEAVAPLSNIYNNGTSGGPAYFIERGFTPSMYVLSPQAVGSGWSLSGSNVDYVIKYMIANYPNIDPNRIYLTGLSAGGDGILQYVTGFFTYKVAAIVPMSEAHGESPASEVQKIVSDSIHVWGFGDPNNDVHGYNTKKLVDDINKLKPAQANFTSYTGGHCCWNNFYNPTYKLNGQTIYDWMAQFSLKGTTPPVVITPPVITPPTSSKSIVLKPGYDNSIYIDRNQASQYSGYDTLFLTGNIKKVNFIGLIPKDTTKKMVITNKGDVTLELGVDFDGCRFINLIKSPSGRFLIQGHPYLWVAKGYGVAIENRSSDINIEGLEMYNLAMGIHLTTFVYCKNQDSLNRIGGWRFRNFSIINCTIRKTFYEGMYISTTNPDNTNPNNLYTPEGCTGYYPEGIRAENVTVQGNSVDSTGRGGIQLGAVDGYAIVEGNNVNHSGMNGNDAQGTNYSLGSYTHAVVKNNIGQNAFTNNLALIGGSAQVTGNTFSGSFTLRAHAYADIEQADIGQYDPGTLPVYDNVAAGLYGNQAAAIYVTTRPNLYKDSAFFQISDNIISSKVKSIWVEDGYGLMKKVGNCMSNNTGTVAAETQIKYATNCTAVPPIPIPPTPPTKTLTLTIFVYSDGTISVQK